MGSTPGLTPGQVPTAAEWNSYFAAKQDNLGFAPLPIAGGAMTGLLITSQSTATSAGINLPPGVAPTTPNNGDMWTTATGAFVRVGGATFNLTAGTAGGGAGGPFVGGTLSGSLTTAASTSAISGLNIAPGVAPTSPNNGDTWITSADMFARIGGSTLPISQPARLSTLAQKASPLQTDLLLLWDTAGSALANVKVGAVGPSGVVLTGTTSNATVGYTFTPNNAGTLTTGTLTPNPALGNYQFYTNNGAHTLAAPSSDSAIDVLVTNGASAGTITFSGFTVSSNTGDSLTTTNTNKFIISIRRINGTSTYLIKALQ